MGRLVVDSMVTWAKAYAVDGFRFDLMGHHPKENILAVRAALDRLRLERDGVDGKAILCRRSGGQAVDAPGLVGGRIMSGRIMAGWRRSGRRS